MFNLRNVFYGLTTRFIMFFMTSIAVVLKTASNPTRDNLDFLLH